MGGGGGYFQGCNKRVNRLDNIQRATKQNKPLVCGSSLFLVHRPVVILSFYLVFFLTFSIFLKLCFIANMNVKVLKPERS